MARPSRIWVVLPLLAASAFAAERPVDHSKFRELKGPFKDGPAVTRACLSCHSQIGADILQTPHWRWKGVGAPIPGHGPELRSIGKANVINNFCIGIQSNEAECTRCHIGYGWKDKSFNFNDPTKIDCLVCHDRTGNYTRAPSADEPLNWAQLAQSVGPTSIETCGSCHFQGGGGPGVKHGDLDPSLLDTDRDLDVHMDKKGLAFTCSTCHRGEEVAHQIAGHSPSVSTRTGDVLSCAKCHGDAPHGQPFIFRTQAEREAARRFRPTPLTMSASLAARLNWHAQRIACQTCHVPRYAKSAPTKVWWDWSKAGERDKDGRPLQTIDAEGNIIYLGIKGEFRWASNLVPEYRWYNGDNERYLVGDRFDPSKVLVLNQPLGGPAIPGSKIWPFKVMHSNQPYDVEKRYLIQPKLVGPKGSGAYWSDFDWDKSARAGMAYVGLSYSGKVGFARTDMYWPLSHMNVEGTRALSCAECHSRSGRLAGIEGVYLPGQSRSRWLDLFGWIAVGAAFLGVLLHALLRLKGRKAK